MSRSALRHRRSTASIVSLSLFADTGLCRNHKPLTAANGSYIITVPLSAKPPFVVQAVSADKTLTLVSVVAEEKDTNTNITPVTNLIASGLSPSGGATMLAGELKANPALFAAAALKTKIAEIVSLIQPLMDAIGDSSDPLNGKLIADGMAPLTRADFINPIVRDFLGAEPA